MILYTRRQIVVLLILLTIAGLGLESQQIVA